MIYNELLHFWGELFCSPKKQQKTARQPKQNNTIFMLFRIACFLCCFDRWICIYHQHQSKKESCTVCNFGCGILMWSCLIFEVWNCLIFLQCLILHMPNIQLIFSLYSANIQLIASYIQLIFSYIQLIAS